MKTSNIILLAVFTSILIWILAAFLTAKAKIKEVIKEHPEFVNEDNEKKFEHIVIDLEPFHTLIVNGNGDLYVEHSEGYSFDQIIDDENTVEIRNDTLYISVNGKDCILNVNKIKNINTKDEVYVKLDDYQADTIKIYTADKSKLEINTLKAKFFKLVTEDKSEVELKNVNYPNIEAEFFIRNYSSVQIDNTKGMALSVKKDPDAKYKDK